jgi:hypothetical protein
MILVEYDKTSSQKLNFIDDFRNFINKITTQALIFLKLIFLFPKKSAAIILITLFINT